MKPLGTVVVGAAGLERFTLLSVGGVGVGDRSALRVARIPGARFRTIESRNILPLPGEPGFDELLRMIEGFVREGE